QALGCWGSEGGTATTTHFRTGSVMRVTTAVCPEADVRAELHRVLGSASFAVSDRNRRFLQYVIEEALAGRSGRLKAYSIATTVFGRPQDFDPTFDPV